MRLRPGDVVHGKYRLARPLGDGGMGTIFEARHEVLGTRLALKFLHPELARRPGLVARFLQEARVSATLRSPHIVHVMDMEQGGQGVFLVMELLEGETLQAALDRRRKLELLAALDVALQMLAGLEIAHRAGVVHRDLKPDNVFMVPTPEGTLVKLLDFGIAKLKAAPEFQRGLTRPGVVMGTPEYMAPEQAFSADAVDARADLYALGVLLFEMLSGQRPVGGDDARSIALHVTRGHVTPLQSLDPTLPAGLVSVIHRSMAPDPAHRFASAAEMRHALLPFAQALSPAARRSIPDLAAAEAAWTPSAALRSHFGTTTGAPSASIVYGEPMPPSGRPLEHQPPSQNALALLPPAPSYNLAANGGPLLAGADPGYVPNGAGPSTARGWPAGNGAEPSSARHWGHGPEPTTARGWPPANDAQSAGTQGWQVGAGAQQATGTAWQLGAPPASNRAWQPGNGVEPTTARAWPPDAPASGRISAQPTNALAVVSGGFVAPQSSGIAPALAPSAMSNTQPPGGPPHGPPQGAPQQHPRPDATAPRAPMPHAFTSPPYGASQHGGGGNSSYGTPAGPGYTANAGAPGWYGPQGSDQNAGPGATAVAQAYGQEPPRGQTAVAPVPGATAIGAAYGGGPSQSSYGSGPQGYGSPPNHYGTSYPSATSHGAGSPAGWTQPPMRPRRRSSSLSLWLVALLATLVGSGVVMAITFLGGDSKNETAPPYSPPPPTATYPTATATPTAPATPPPIPTLTAPPTVTAPPATATVRPPPRPPTGAGGAGPVGAGGAGPTGAGGAGPGPTATNPGTLPFPTGLPTALPTALPSSLPPFPIPLPPIPGFPQAPSGQQAPGQQ